MSGERLSPARPDGGDGSAYAPRFPWKWTVGLLALVAVGVVAWQLQTQARLRNFKAKLLEAHAQYAEAEDLRQTFQERVEKLINKGIETEPQAFADPRLDLSELYRGEGIYLRVPVDVDADLESLEQVALSARGDAVPRCLGVGPTSLRGLYESGLFLGEAFRKRIHDASDELVLDGLAAELKRRGMQHVAASATARRADYFLLLVERGPNGQRDPVDAFLWKLSRDGDALLLSARTIPNGLLVPARIAVGGITPPQHAPLRESPIADDCSIAAQIKEVAGVPAQQFHAAPSAGSR